MDFYFYGLKLHPITFTILFAEGMLCYSYAKFYMSRPSLGDQKYWQAIFLSLLIVVTSKQLFLPILTTNLNLAEPVQFFLGRGFGYALASYFPLYLYQMLNFQSLKWHGKYGPLCILAPVVIVFGVIYPIRQDMMEVRIIMLILPVLYFAILIYDSLRLIIGQYHKTKDRRKLKEQLLIVLNVAPWIIVPFISIFLNAPIWVCDAFLNVPFLISSWFFDKWIEECYLAKAQEQKELKELYFEKKIENVPTLKTDDETKKYLIDLLETAANPDFEYPSDPFAKTCKMFGFTEGEKKVMKQLIHRNDDYKTIANELRRSPRTIEKHAESMRKKASVSTKEELIEKFIIPLNG